jgi:hypothetical protein
MELSVNLAILEVQPPHLLNHSSEERSNGFPMPKILKTGESIKWKLLMLEFLIGLLCFKLRRRLFLKVKLLTEVLVKLAISEVQLLHLLNLSLEERNNGFPMPKTLKSGESIKWKLPMQEFLIGLLWFRPLISRMMMSQT